MSEKEVLEIDVDSGKAEAALTRYNQLLNQHDSATEKAAASSAKLDQAISRSSTAYDTLKSKLASVGQGAQEAFGKLETGTQKLANLSNSIGQQTRKFDELSHALDKASATYGESSNEAEALRTEMAALLDSVSELDGELATAAGELDTFAQAFDETIAGSEEAQAAAKDYADSLVDVATAGSDAEAGLQQTAEATKKTGDAADKGKTKVEGMAAGFGKLATQLSALPGPLGQAGQQLQGLLSNIEAGGAAFEGLSAGTIAGGLALAGFTAAIGLVKSSIDTLVEYATKVSEVGVKTGESIQFISGLAEAADDAAIAMTGEGVSLDQVGAALERFSRNLGRGIDENGNFTEANKNTERALAELGVKATDSTGKLRDIKDLLPDIADGFERIGAGAQATSLAKQLGLTDLLPLLLQGSEGVRNLSSVISSDGVQATLQYKSALDSLEDTVRDLKVSLGSIVLPSLASELEGIASGIATIKAALSFSGTGANNLLSFLSTGKFPKSGLEDIKRTGNDLVDSFLKSNGVLGLLVKSQIDRLREAYPFLLDATKQNELYGRNAEDAHDRAAQSISREIDALGALEGAIKSGQYEFDLNKVKELDTRKEDVATKRDNDSNLVKQQQADLAAARQAAAAERAAKATDALARLQANLAKSADLVTAAFDGEVKALGRLETAKALLDIVNGKSTVQDFQKGQVAAGISEAVAKGQVPIAKGVAVASELGKGNISPEAAALLLPAGERKTVLGNINAVNQGVTDVNNLIGSGQITPEGLLTDLANQKVPVVRRLTRNVPLQETAQGVVDAQANAKSVADARAAALKQGEASGLSPAQLKVLGDSFNAPIEAANKAQKEAEAKYAAIKPKIDSTLATPFVAQQKQLAELGNQRDTTVRELKAAGKSQDEINKVTAEYNEKIKKQTETNEKTNKLLGAGVSTLGSTTETTTQVVGSRVIGTKGAQNIKDQIDKAFGTTGGETQIEVKLNAAGFEKLDELQQAFANLKRDDQIKLLVSLTGAKDVDELLTKLDNAPSEKEINLALQASGMDSIAGLLQFINDPKSKDQEIKFQATLDAFGAKTPEEFKTKLALLSDSEIVLALKTSGIDDPEALLGLIRGQLGAGVTVPVKAEPVPVGPNNPLLTPQGFGLPPQITVPVTAGAVPPATTKGANDALDTINDKTVAIKGDDADLLAKVDASNKQVAAMPDKTIALLGDTAGIDKAVKDSNAAVDAMPNKTVYLYADNQGVTDSVNNAKIALNSLPASKTIEIHVKTIQETIPAKCFAAGTPIATPRGYVPIETIQAGDEVYAFDHEHALAVPARVKQTFTNTAEWMCHFMFFSGVVLVATFTCTPGHPIWLESRQDYVPAQDVLTGESVRSVSGDLLTVGAIYYTLGGPTFNFEVETHHNYFAAGVLVHNRSEHVDQQIAGLVGSLNTLAHLGAPGAFAEAQRMISHTLLPYTVSNSNSTTNDRRIMQLNANFQANTPLQVEMAFDVMQSMAEAR